MRAGTSGLFYFSGIAFNRGDGGIGKVFVSRFIDNNNKDGGDPIQYLGSVVIDTGTSGQFLDKPWLVADIPRGGPTCNINGRQRAGRRRLSRLHVVRRRRQQRPFEDPVFEVDQLRRDAGRHRRS